VALLRFKARAPLQNQTKKQNHKKGTEAGLAKTPIHTTKTPRKTPLRRLSPRISTLFRSKAVAEGPKGRQAGEEAGQKEEEGVVSCAGPETGRGEGFLAAARFWNAAATPDADEPGNDGGRLCFPGRCHH
jgi:hypothetical protein